jgi:hypothetical protein
VIHLVPGTEEKNKVSISKASKQIPVQRFMIRYEKFDDKSHYAENMSECMAGEKGVQRGQM